MDLTTKAKILITYVLPLRIEDDSTGEITEGFSLEYFFFGEHGETLEGDFVSPKEASGLRRCKAFLRGTGWLDKFVMVPALYHGDFTMNIDKDGKTKLALADISYCSKAVLSEAAPKNPVDGGEEGAMETPDVKGAEKGPEAEPKKESGKKDQKK